MRFEYGSHHSALSSFTIVVLFDYQEWKRRYISAMTFRFFSPPRLHLQQDKHDRHTTWLETFYDLVFAIAISALGSRFGRDLSPAGLLQFLGLFLPVWWAWLGHTVYNTRFDTDDVLQRLCTFGIMLAAAAMAVSLPQVFEGSSAAFAAAYVGARVSLLILYTRAWYHAAEARPITTVYLTGFSLGTLLWALSIVLPPPTQYLLWTVGLAVELATPWLGLHILRRAPLDTSHLPERLGLFTIIVLGEIIYRVVMSVGTKSQSSSLLAAVLAFGLIICIWWMYFTFIETAPFADSLGPGQPYIYLHFPLLIGLTMLSVGLARAVNEASHPVLLAATCALIGAGVVLWLSAGLFLKLVSIQQRWPFWLVGRSVGVMLCVIVLLSFGSQLPPLSVLGLLLLVLGAFVAFEMSS